MSGNAAPLVDRTSLVLIFGTWSFEFQPLSEQDPWSFQIDSCQIFTSDLENKFTNYWSIKIQDSHMRPFIRATAKSLMFVKTLQSLKTPQPISNIPTAIWVN